jgi:hypothetical protein
MFHKCTSRENNRYRRSQAIFLKIYIVSGYPDGHQQTAASKRVKYLSPPSKKA